MRKKLVVISSLFMVVLMTTTSARAGWDCSNTKSLPIEAIDPCKNEFSQTLEAISSANATNSQQLLGLQRQILALQNQVGALDNRLLQLSQEIFEKQVKKGVREELLAKRLGRDYREKRDLPVLLLLFSKDHAVDFFRSLILREKVTRTDRNLIQGDLQEIRDLNDQVASVQAQKLSLKDLKERVDVKAKWLADEVAKANAYVSDLSGKIAALTARQNELLAAKTGTYQTSVGDVPLADDPAARPDYNPGFSPAYALFSFGAPHFKGMSQYGAFGRAKNGQSYETILKAYYGNVRVQDVNTSLSIRTTAGTMSFEDRYVMGIAEMPGQWGDEGGMEALKAQAIAARSYALAYTGWRMGNQNAGGTICVTESCQVWRNSKADNPGKWREAVEQTKGKILVSNNSNEVVNAFYASTSGGYQESYTSLGHTTPGFWDTTSDWTRWADGAWEVKGGSPWFYKGWYKGRSGTACGKSHPWLHEDEFADIVNAALVYSNGGDASGVFPTDGCLGQTGWDKNRMAAEADKYGGRVSSVSSVRADHGSNGVTNKVILSTNRGNVEISGTNFYKVFNLRAPGAIHLKSGLFNVEKK